MKQYTLIEYTLQLADNSLILAQRNSEWCGHGPILEQDIAITNISLDLIGQARNFYQYAALLINASPLSDRRGAGGETSSPLSDRRGVGGEAGATEATEDSLAYLRTEREFKNCLLVELPNGDWAQTVLRQFFFSAYQHLLYTKLQDSKDEQLSAIAAKSLKEVIYHLRWSSEWVIRLGDGTTESRQRIIKALDALWMYTGELFELSKTEEAVVTSGEGVNPAALHDEWTLHVKAVFDQATLTVPENIFMQKGGKEGKHTEHLGYILTELQYLQRTYPGAEW